MPTIVSYYITVRGRNPVYEFVNSLPHIHRAKLRRILTLAETYELNILRPYIRKLSGTELWEIRILGKHNIRVFYIASAANCILLLHGFIKKTPKTPFQEIKTAENRLADWRQRYQAGTRQ